MKAAGSTPWSASAKRIAVPVPQEVLRPLSRRILLVEDQWSLIEIGPGSFEGSTKAVSCDGSFAFDYTANSHIALLESI
jgi:hypothetical protein